MTKTCRGCPHHYFDKQGFGRCKKFNNNIVNPDKCQYSLNLVALPPEANIYFQTKQLAVEIEKTKKQVTLGTPAYTRLQKLSLNLTDYLTDYEEEHDEKA